MKWFIKCLRNYATFSGRARRKEYWMFTLFATLLLSIGIILDHTFFPNTIIFYYGVITILLALALMLPSIAVAVRRLHDTGRSGAWYFVTFIPYIGSIWLFVLMCFEGNRFDNQYGLDPKDTIRLEDVYMTE